jgi:transposase
VPTGIAGRRSHSLAYKEIIEELLTKGLDGMRIYQDLVCEHGFEGSYDSVRRFIKKLGSESPERVWRMECAPGEEVQVDYGTMYVLEDEKGRLKKVHVLRVSLSHSRKSYSEAMVRQDTESFIRALENAFRYFGGSVAQICLDNLTQVRQLREWFC